MSAANVTKLNKFNTSKMKFSLNGSNNNHQTNNKINPINNQKLSKGLLRNKRARANGKKPGIQRHLRNLSKKLNQDKLMHNMNWALLWLNQVLWILMNSEKHQLNCHSQFCKKISETQFYTIKMQHISKQIYMTKILNQKEQLTMFYSAMGRFHGL